MYNSECYAPAIMNALPVIFIIVTFEDVRFELRKAGLFISIVEFSFCADWGRIDSDYP